MLLHTYDPRWVQDFEQIRRELDAALHGLSYTIEHVGSTSVPGLDAKPIIDIDIIHEAPSEFAGIKAALESIGYYHNGNQGIPDREAFKRSGLRYVDVLDRIQHHLYVCPEGSKALERHILLRNYLRKHEWARIRYLQMKYELAERAGQDRKTYADLKELHVNTFIDAIIEEERNSAI